MSAAAVPSDFMTAIQMAQESIKALRAEQKKIAAQVRAEGYVDLTAGAKLMQSGLKKVALGVWKAM